MNLTRELVAAIDIGTLRTRAAIGRFTSDGKLEIVAVGDALTQGVRNGVVVNIDEAAVSIRTVISSLEKTLNLRVQKVYAGISGQKINNRQATGYRMTENGEVTQAIINSLIDEAQRYSSGPGEKVYHLIPQEFIVDGERNVPNPVGMAGRRIDAAFTVISAAESYELNLKRSIEKAGYELVSAFINPFVQGSGFLSKDEKEAGVILLDFGAGTTGMSLYYENKLRLATELPFGGNVISNDIREGCNIIPRHAEMVKVQCGYAFSELVPDNKFAQIPEVEGWHAKEISFRNLSGIIQARLEEIIEGVNYQLESTGLLNKLGAGIVLTGGGSNMRGIDKLVSYMTGIDVRFGKPVVAIREQLFNEQIMNAESANLIGLLINGLYAARRNKYPPGMIISDVQEEAKKKQLAKNQGLGLKTMVSDLFGRAKDGFNGLISDDDSEIN
ncbi:MAG: cell division protein FtsA [Bacteroidia bacterium]|nr:cell division protein FtsA [Bacteroidia bacterium]